MEQKPIILEIVRMLVILAVLFAIPVAIGCFSKLFLGGFFAAVYAVWRTLVGKAVLLTGGLYVVYLALK